MRRLRLVILACVALGVAWSAHAQLPLAVWMQSVQREHDTVLVVRDDERSLSRALERALARCTRGSGALAQGRYTVLVATDERGRAHEVSGASEAVDACLLAARLRARASSRYRVVLDVSSEDPGAALSSAPPDVTGTGAASEPDRCQLLLVPGGIELAIFEAGVTMPGAAASDERVHAFWMHGPSWPLRLYAEMRHARTEADGTLVFAAALEGVARGEQLAGWVSVDGGRTMAYCDRGGPPFDPSELLVAP